MTEKKDLSLKAIRHLLASVDLSDLEEPKDMSEQERKTYCAQIFAVFPILEKDIKRFLYSQLMFVCNEASNMDEVSFGRGTFNGMDLLLEHWKKASSEYEAIPKEEMGFDKNKVIGEI
jgi:hypothetical protein